MGAAVASSGGGGSRRRRSRRLQLNSEINVTPFVDVMLVLLIVFMVSAPLLTVGVPIDLPETKGAQLASDTRPITVSVQGDGKVFLGESVIPLEELAPKLKAITANAAEKPIFVRGDKSASYGDVLVVMGALQGAGFAKIGLVGLPKPE